MRRLRWAVRATLGLGVAVSVAANILHAQPHPISQAIAAWPPLALLLTVELISRIPSYRRSLAAVRLVATAAIAGIAAWVSYWHMAGVAARYGETGASAFLLPLSVDGLVIVASISLVEIAGRISAATPQHQPAYGTPALPTPGALATPATTTMPPATPSGAAAPMSGALSPSAPMPPPETQPSIHFVGSVPAPWTPPTRPAVSGTETPPAAGASEVAADGPAPHATGCDHRLPDGGEPRDVLADTVEALPAAGSDGTRPPSSSHAEAPGPDAEAMSHPAADRSTTEQPGTSQEDFRDYGSVPSETAAAVAYWYRRDPNLHPAKIGARIGRSERTVRRYWPPVPSEGPTW